MTTRVKICGIRTVEVLDASLDGGADYVGLVFYPPSPRALEPAAAGPLADRARGRAEIVALLVDPTDDLVARVLEATRPDLLQLHGSESIERIAAIKHRFGVRVMKAIKVATPDDIDAALGFAEVADLVLFDAKAPTGMAGALPGGNGLSFDWRMLDAVKDRLPFMLSGGLTPANVADAVRLTGAWAVDVSSGVETRPGDKDLGLIAAFLAAAKAA